MITLEAWEIDKMLEALEGAKWLIESYVFNPSHYEEYRDVVEAIEKARSVEGEDYCPGTAEQEANASMIAAAPDMLEALDNVYGGCWIDRDSYGPFVQKKITMEEYEAMGIAIKKARSIDAYD